VIQGKKNIMQTLGLIIVIIFSVGGIICSLLFSKSREQRIGEDAINENVQKWYKYKYRDANLRDLAKKNNEHNKKSYITIDSELYTFKRYRSRFVKCLRDKGIKASPDGNVYTTFCENTRLFKLDEYDWIFAAIEDDGQLYIYNRGCFEEPFEEFFLSRGENEVYKGEDRIYRGKNEVYNFLKETTGFTQATTDLIEALQKNELTEIQRHDRWKKRFSQKL